VDDADEFRSGLRDYFGDLFPDIPHGPHRDYLVQIFEEHGELRKSIDDIIENFEVWNEKIQKNEYLFEAVTLQTNSSTEPRTFEESCKRVAELFEIHYHCGHTILNKLNLLSVDLDWVPIQFLLVPKTPFEDRRVCRVFLPEVRTSLCTQFRYIQQLPILKTG
jgi:hypothetical protein